MSRVHLYHKLVYAIKEAHMGISFNLFDMAIMSAFISYIGPGTTLAVEGRYWTQPGSGDRKTHAVLGNTKRERLYSGVRASYLIV